MKYCHEHVNTFQCRDQQGEYARLSGKMKRPDKKRRKSQPNTGKILTQNPRCFTCLVSKAAVLTDGKRIEVCVYRASCSQNLWLLPVVIKLQ